MPNPLLSRRDLLRRTGMGFPALGLGAMLHAGTTSAASPLAPKAPPLAAKAKRVIHLFMNGGPSHVDTFDPKPSLTKFHGKPIPIHLRTERKTAGAMASPFQFAKHGQAGTEVSEIFPNIASVVDDLCVIRSMHTDLPNHEPSLMMMNCGTTLQVRPSFGSWITYGLGSENQNLPGFIALCPGGLPVRGGQNWRSAFLPGAFQGTHIDTQNTEVEKLIENIKNHATTLDDQRRQLDLLAALNRRHQQGREEDLVLEARVQSFELAYRMQTEAENAFDISGEPEHIRKMYGEGVYARQVLSARRLLERGVRFVQVWHGAGQPWDNHNEIERNHRRLAGQCDQPIAALIRDLKQRGLLDDTLVIWGGEFGRTPTVELTAFGSNDGVNGRDHNPYGFTVWLAGGGVRRGYVHGATDEFGFRSVENRVHVHDLHATLLHLLGFDHERFTFRYAGRDFRLTDVHGVVVKDLLA
jgi:hypothetical protein